MLGYWYTVHRIRSSKSLSATDLLESAYTEKPSGYPESFMHRLQLHSILLLLCTRPGYFVHIHLYPAMILCFPASTQKHSGECGRIYYSLHAIMYSCLCLHDFICVCRITCAECASIYVRADSTCLTCNRARHESICMYVYIYSSYPLRYALNRCGR